MCSDYFTEINNAIIKSSDNTEMLDNLNSIFLKMEYSDKLGMHSLLSMDALVKIYLLIDQVDLEPNVKEHITWYYFKKLTDGKSGIEDYIVDEILKSYKKYGYLAIESLIVDWIRFRKLTNSQVIRVEENIQNDKEIQKRINIFKMQDFVDKGGILDKQKVKTLIEFRAYYEIEKFIDRKAISEDSYDEFREPEDNEQDKKIKKIIFQKVRKLRMI